MLDLYKQFRDFHVFKKFKYLLGDWWNIDILIVVQDGKKLFYENNKPFNNPIVKVLLQSSVFKSYFFSSLRPVINKTFSNIQNPQLLPWKQTGLDLFVAPVGFKLAHPSQSSKAFLIAVGFSPKREKELKQALSYLSLSNKAIEQKIKSLKALSSTDEVYIQKMLKILTDELFLIFKEKKAEKLKQEQSNSHSVKTYGYMMGQSSAMQYVFNVLNKIKNYDGCVLIEGAPGTGKRLLAKTIHLESLRSHKSFYVQNFSTFKGSFLEATLFGAHKNSSRAVKHKKSLVQKLEGGTLLLNEIGHTSLDFQNQLLQFLKTSIFFKEGELKDKKYNVRVIASTSQDLKQLIKAGEFNEKLYFAINAMNITVPPLKYRKMDIPLLAQYFLSKKSPSKQLRFSKQALKFLYDYSWPGNIQELESEIEKMVSLKSKDQTVFTEQDLSNHIREFSFELDGLFVSKNQNLKETLRLVEKQILLDCLRKNNWNKSKTAQLLGTSRTSLVSKAREYGLFKKGA